MSTSKTITTTDIVLAAACKCLGDKITHIETQGHKGAFTIATTEERTTAFYLGELSVEPAAFHACLRQLTSAAKGRN